MSQYSQSAELGAKNNNQMFTTPARDDKPLAPKQQLIPSDRLFEDCATDQEYLQRLKKLDQRGRIELIMGTMFAGKSTELLRRIRKHEITGKKVLRVKFSADNRYGEKFMITTHGGQSREAIPVTKLEELGDVWKEFDVIGIDEGQFFADIVSFAEMAANSRKIVLISSLQGTFVRGAWSNINELIPLCEKVKKLSAICKLCKQNAHFTFRTADKNCKNMIGGADMYMPLCRECHARESKLNSDNQFDGDCQLVDVTTETEAQNSKKERAAVMDDSADTTLTSNGQEQSGSPALKSFSSDLEGAELSTLDNG